MSGTRGPTTRTTRVCRAAAASAFGVLVALAAHLAGGGAAPPGVVLVAAVVLVQPLAVVLAGRRPALWRQAAVIGLAQAAMHAVFSLGTVRGGRVYAADDMAGMHGPVDLSGVYGMHSSHDMSTMWAWHAVAWALTTAAWRWGEAAAGVLVAGVRRVVRRTLGPVLPVAGPRTGLAPSIAVPVPGALRRADPRRGPPILR